MAAALVAATIATLAAVGVGAAPAAAQTGGGLFVFAGADRIETALAVSRASYPLGAERVYLARADAFPDALAGASLGGGALLLVPSAGAAPAAVVAEVNRLRPSLVVVFGGAAAVGDDMVGQVAGGRDVQRLGGDTRFDTAVQISQFGFAGGAREVYLARADDFADALAAGSLHGGPVLLVPRSGAVPDSVRAEVARLQPERVLALGGEAAVPGAILQATAGGRATARLEGPDRYSTAVAIARYASPGGVGEVVAVVSGTNFPDGLAAGGIDRGPVLLVPQCGAIPGIVAEELGARRPQSLGVIGGPAAVCAGLVEQVGAAAGVSSGGGAFVDPGPDPDQITPQLWAAPIRYAWGEGTRDLANWQAVIERAMATWEAAGGVDFVPAGGGPADIVIGFGQGCHPTIMRLHECFDGPGAVLAHASIGNPAPIQAWLHFDDAHVYVDGAGALPPLFDLETVALHELGHVLGIGHLAPGNAVMHEAYTGPRRQLTQADIDALRSLYPVPIV